MKRLFIVILSILILSIGAFAQSGEFNLGIKSANLGSFQIALEHFQKAFDQNLAHHKIAQIHYNIAVCYYRLNQPNKAVTEFEKAISLRKSYDKAFYGLGMAHSDLRNWIEAETALSQSIKFSKGRNGEVWFDLGVVLIEQQDYVGAKSAFQNAIKFGSKASLESTQNVEILTKYLKLLNKSLLAKLVLKEAR